MRSTARTPLLLALLLAAVTVVSLGLFTQARASTVVPLGVAQTELRNAYRAAASLSSEYGRLHWAQASFVPDDPIYNSETYPAGTLVAPDGISGDNYDKYILSGDVNSRPALAINGVGTRIAVLRSTVSDPTFGNVAWEIADVREVLEGYLDGELRYDILDEAALATADLSQYALVIAPSVRLGNEQDVLNALDPAALDNLAAFVRNGGFFYAQSNGAIIAEAAGLIAPGTVDLANPLQLAPGEPFNTGKLAVLDPNSPLTFSWLDDTLYILNDPSYYVNEDLDTVAEFTNLDGSNQPAIVTGRVGDGQVILVNGHPTAVSRRSQVPIFMNAVLWALGGPAELFGQARQTYNPDLDPTLIPAFEEVPVRTTLTFNNLWDTPLSNVVISETVQPGFTVQPGSIFPKAGLYDGTVEVITTTDGLTHIVWTFASLPAGELPLGFTAFTDVDALQQGDVVFSTGEAAYTLDGRPYVSQHRPFRLSARMAARLVADRDLELDRGFGIPAAADGGLIFDIAAPIENKEDTAAVDVVVTDVVVCMTPMVDLDHQDRILNDTNGETLWVVNEPFFYNERGTPYVPADGYAPGDSISLEECDGPPAVFDVARGIYGEVLDGTSNVTETRGLYGESNYITIPAGYTDYITLTEAGELLLPTKVLTWSLGDWAGYAYEEPAIRYGLQSTELFGRKVVFENDPDIMPEDVIVENDGGSVYTNLGDYPIFYREQVTSGRVFPPQTAVAPTITYADIWSRPHTITLRAAFYDLFTWSACPCNGEGGGIEEHASLNVSFEMQADLDGDGERDDDVLFYPSRLDSTNVDIVLRSRNLGDSIGSDEMVIDMGMFRGLGVSIEPRSGDWTTSFRSSNAAELVDIVQEGGYDRLLFQKELASEGIEELVLEAVINRFQGRVTEGMIKLHDGARLTYRQQFAGPSRYEVYDTRVQGVVGAAAELNVRKQGSPIEVSTYGDTVYYIITVDDAGDPRTLRRNGPGDPFLQSFGFGTSAATTYVGGREGREILHSIVSPGEMTRIRVEINNNTDRDWTNVQVIPQPPEGISITRTYEGTIPPIFYDLPFMYLESIPSVGRAVYLYDVYVDPDYVYSGNELGRIVEIPFRFTAEGASADFQIPPAQLGIDNGNGEVITVYSPATGLELTDKLPPEVELLGAAVVSRDEIDALTEAADDATKAALFAGFAETLAYSETSAGDVTFDLPADALERIYTLTGDNSLRIVAQAAITPTQAGPLLANLGATATYTDEFGIQWQHTSEPFMVEVHGAVIQVNYDCVGTGSSLASIYGDDCLLQPDAYNNAELLVTIANVGDYPAQEVEARLVLPAGVTVLDANPAASIGEGEVTWQVGDMAPGGFIEVSLTIGVELNKFGETELAAIVEQPVTLVDYTDGRFYETYAQRWIETEIGGAFNVGTEVDLAAQRTIYLPLVARGTPTNIAALPDLVVTTFEVTPQNPVAGAAAEVVVEITNAGDAASGPFWVDFFIGPDAPPTAAGTRWDDACGLEPCDGIAWIVQGLEPGASVRLTSASFEADYSRWNGAFMVAGTHDLYVYADIWSAAGDTDGAVEETSEDNNRAVLPAVTVGAGSVTGVPGMAPLARPAPELAVR
ncbi:MAG: hypothetical protein HC876_10875 [Chloroflexaceae bacterium]|nr:hypothetical protein [Chloroflexaceae bacterium]